MPRKRTALAERPTPTAPAQAKKKAPASQLFGHCATGKMVEEGRVNGGEPRQWHQNCPATLMNGNGRITACSCACHENHTICRDCGAIDVPMGERDPDPKSPDPDALVGRCLDRDACATTVLRRARTNATWQQCQESKAAGERARAEDAERKRVERERRAAEARAAEGGADEAPAAPPKAPRQTGQPCHCGCGGMTKGGQFVMGHDMKLKGVLYAVARDSKVKKAPPNPHPKEDRVAATAEIIARGWNEVLIPDAIRKAAIRGKWEMAPDLVIDSAVAARYAAQREAS